MTSAVCSPPNALLQKASAECSYEPGYYATEEQIRAYHASGYGSDARRVQIQRLGKQPRESLPQNVFEPSCGATIGNVDY